MKHGNLVPNRRAACVRGFSMNETLPTVASPNSRLRNPVSWPHLVRRTLIGVLAVFWSSTCVAHSPAQSHPKTDGNVAPTPAREQRIPARQLNSGLLVDVGKAATALGWEAEVVTPGKLLTLCRVGDQHMCIPIRLDATAFRATSDGMFVDAETVARALRIQFGDYKDGAVALVPRTDASAAEDAIPAYNADWGPGRGFRVGQTVPDIPLIDLQGHEVRFSKFLGKRYIVYCWASW